MRYTHMYVYIQHLMPLYRLYMRTKPNQCSLGIYHKPNKDISDEHDEKMHVFGNFSLG